MTWPYVMVLLGSPPQRTQLLPKSAERTDSVMVRLYTTRHVLAIVNESLLILASFCWVWCHPGFDKREPHDGCDARRVVWSSHRHPGERNSGFVWWILVTSLVFVVQAKQDAKFCKMIGVLQSQKKTIKKINGSICRKKDPFNALN